VATGDDGKPAAATIKVGSLMGKDPKPNLGAAFKKVMAAVKESEGECLQSVSGK